MSTNLDQRIAFVLLFQVLLHTGNFCQEAQTVENELSSIEKQDNDSSKVASFIQIAERLENSDREKAIAIYNKAASLAMRLNNPGGIAKARHYAGILYANKADYSKALIYYNEALQQYRNTGYKIGIGSVLANIGNVHQFMGDVKKAMEFYLQAVAHFEEASDSTRLSILYNNLGGAFSILKNNKKAIYYSEKALHLAEKLQLNPKIVDACVNLSKAYVLDKDTAKAVQYLQKGLSLASTYEDYKTLNYLHNNLGAIYMNQDKTIEALQHLELALKYSVKNAEPYDIATTNFSLAVYYKLQKQWNRAEAYCLQAIKLADSLQIHELLAKAYNVLSDIEEQRGNYKKAYQHYIAYTAYNDSLRNKEQVQLIHEMEEKYQSSRKDKALSQQQLLLERSKAAIRQKNNLILFALSGSVIAILVALLVYFLNRHKRKLEVQRISALEKEKELKILQALMKGEENERTRIAGQLHDGVGGMVSAIKMHMGVSKMENGALASSPAYRQALHLIDELAVEVRKTAHNLMPELLHQYGLEEALRIYCQNIGNGKSLEIHFQSYQIGNLTSSAELFVYRTVQELLNNAIKHAECSEVLVDIATDETHLTVTVEDNGKGFQAKKTIGMGLHNIQSKVAAMEGKTEILSESGTGSTITIEIPLQNLELA